LCARSCFLCACLRARACAWGSGRVDTCASACACRRLASSTAATGRRMPRASAPSTAASSRSCATPSRRRPTRSASRGPAPAGRFRYAYVARGPPPHARPMLPGWCPMVAKPHLLCPLGEAPAWHCAVSARSGALGSQVGRLCDRGRHDVRALHLVRRAGCAPAPTQHAKRPPGRPAGASCTHHAAQPAMCHVQRRVSCSVARTGVTATWHASADSSILVETDVAHVTLVRFSPPCYAAWVLMAHCTAPRQLDPKQRTFDACTLRATTGGTHSIGCRYSRVLGTYRHNRRTGNRTAA
jgi:hypothetical protein